jgi:hypothetical protein
MAAGTRRHGTLVQYVESDVGDACTFASSTSARRWLAGGRSPQPTSCTGLDLDARTRPKQGRAWRGQTQTARTCCQRRAKAIPFANVHSLSETDKALVRPLAAVSDQALKLEQRLAECVDSTLGR